MATKVLVLGANGAIAQHVIAFLQHKENIELTLFARNAEQLAEFKSSSKIIKEPAVLQPKISTSNDADIPAEEPHHLFDFLTTDKHEDGLIEALGGLLPEAQGEDYEEQDFANKMKKKRKRRRGQQ